MIIALIASATSAEAQQLTKLQKARVDVLKHTADRASSEGNFADAVTNLDRALQIATDDPELVLALSRAYDEWGGHCANALAELARFFSLHGDAELVERGRSEEALIANRCASDVTIETDPPGAIVQISGEEYARAAPFTTQLKPGSYAIDVRRRGYIARHVELFVEPTTPQKVPVALEIDPVLSARPAKEPTKVQLVAPAQPEHPLPVRSYAALGAGVAGGIAGVVFTALAIDKVDEERRVRFAGGGEAEISSLRSSAKTNAALAYVGFGISLAGFAAAVVLDSINE